MTRGIACFAACLIGVAMAPAAAADSPKSPYAGQQTRSIKSLSAEDITELRNGGGWGLAKAAELNGVPGPAHLLELGDAIGLTADQRQAVEAIRAAMKIAAIRQGRQLIDLEAVLDRRFKNKTITERELATLLTDIAMTRRDLRLTHLSAHLKTASVVTEAQVAIYNRLRGYASDPCDAVPAGHDPALWRKHNDCR